MATGASRVVLVLVTLVVGFAAGWVVGPDLPPLFPPRGIKVIVIGPKAADISIPKVRVSRGETHVLFWVSKKAGKELFIEFAEQPFQNMQSQSNGRFRVDCKGRQCYSGEIDPNAAYKEYKYWQVLVDPNGTRDEVDGQLIIER